jgi:hypothetical protein
MLGWLLVEIFGQSEGENDIDALTLRMLMKELLVKRKMLAQLIP